jgi:uncharacterized protein YceH (UPF0502 family)
VLDRLSERALVLKLERAPGRREERYVHLLGEKEAALKQATATAGREFHPERSPVERVSSVDISALHTEIAELKLRIEALEAHFSAWE